MDAGGEGADVMELREAYEFMKLISTPIDEIGLSNRTLSPLKRWGRYCTWIDIIKSSPYELRKVRNIGGKAVSEIENSMREAFGSDFSDDWSGNQEHIADFLKNIEDVKCQAVRGAELVEMTCNMFWRKKKDWYGRTSINCAGCPFDEHGCSIKEEYPKDWGLL